MNHDRRRWARFAVGIGCAGVFIWLVMRRLDFGEVAGIASRISLPLLAAAVLSLALGYSLRIVRWWLMLHASDATLKLAACAWPLLVSVSVNNIVPLRAGDALRVVGFRKQLAAGPARVLATLLLERILDLTVLLALFFVGLGGVASEAIPHAYVRACAVIACLGLLAWIAALVFASRLESLLLRACEHRVLAARNWTRPAREHVGQFVAALSVLRSPVVAGRLLGLSAAAWVCEGGVFALVAHGLGFSGDPRAPWFSAAAGTLATLIPSSPGYVGTFDFFTMSALMAYGATAALAGAFALLVHTLLWLPLTATGLIYFLLPGSRTHNEAVAAAPLAHQQDHQ